MKLLKIIYTILFFFIFLSPLATLQAQKWDIEYWHLMNWDNWKSGNYRLYTVLEAYFDHDCSKLYHSQLSSCFAYTPLSALDLEIHYSYIYSKSRGAQFFGNLNRLELEIIPNHTFSNGISVRWRNRLEIIKRQNISKLAYILRDKVLFNFPIKNKGKLSAIQVANEIFYDFNLEQIIQNRFFPCRLIFKLDEQYTLGIYVMQRIHLSANHWYRSIVFGTELTF